MEKRVSTSNLKTGMYISNLDRPWVESPFMFQGFRIQSLEDIQQLRHCCQYVFIDPDLGVPADHYLDEGEEFISAEGLEALRSNHETEQREVYTSTTSVEEEMETAKLVHAQALDVLRTVMENVRSGEGIDVGSVQETVHGMMDSVLRNPDAFTLLTRLRCADSYAFTHAVDTCALVLAFGRYLGLPKTDLQDLATGTLLLDIGKMRLPHELLARPGQLTADEFSLIKQHVEFGVETLSKTPGISERAIDLVRTHHERHNGKGYPRGLIDAQIPVFGRMAAIADCYDAITTDRPYAHALSPHEAIRKLYQWRNIDFQDELVEQFIQCLGVYPTSTLVELSTGEVGIVLAQNRTRRLRPKIMVILDPGKIAYPNPPTLDLMDRPNDEAGRPLEILRALNPGAFGIDPQEFYL